MRKFNSPDLSNTKYNKIGTGYNSTRKADPFLVSRLVYLLQPHPTKLYLDIGCGTGNYTIALSDYGLKLYGIEPSEIMLEKARSRNHTISWLLGTAEAIPTNDEMFDGAIATLTVHHWIDIPRSAKELYRVLRANAKIVFLTSTPEQMKGYWLNRYFPMMLSHSIAQMPSLETISDAFQGAGFAITGTEKYFVKDDLQDNFLYVGKHWPELYFDEKIRAGISSFASLAHKEEVEKGLSTLRNDLDMGLFPAVKKEYDNDLGDYLFIVVEKLTEGI